MRHNLQQPAQPTRAGVTELVLARENQSQLAMVLPMVAHLSRQAQDRWISWIAPQDISREQLETYGFDLGKLRLIHTRNDEETRWVLWQALAQGNSDVVLGSPGKLSDRDFSNLEQAAYTGDCQGLLIRYR